VRPTADQPPPAPVVVTRSEPAPPPLPSLASSAKHFGHAADYSWLKGEVQQSLKGMRLRYAPVDEEDLHGGSVTLLSDGQVDGLKDGQLVQVRGHLVSVESRAPAPPYKVLSVEPLSH
jgi:hypothetical protein